MQCKGPITKTAVGGFQVKSVFIPTEKALTSELCAPLIATLALEVICIVSPVKIALRAPEYDSLEILAFEKMSILARHFFSAVCMCP